MKCSKSTKSVLTFNFAVCSCLLFNGCQTFDNTNVETETSIKQNFLNVSNNNFVEPDSVVKLPPKRPIPCEQVSEDQGSTNIVTTVQENNNICEQKIQSNFEMPSVYVVQKGDSFIKIANLHGIALNNLLELNNLDKNSVLKVGQVLKLNTKTQLPETAKELNFPDIYVVRKGDTISKLAKQAHVSVSQLKTANGLTSDVIRVGQKLNVPKGSHFSKQKVARKSSSAKIPSGTGVHIVQSGETMAFIAKQTGMSLKKLMSLNPSANPKKLKIGQRLIVSAPKGANFEASQSSDSDKKPDTSFDSQIENSQSNEANVPSKTDDSLDNFTAEESPVSKDILKETDDLFDVSQETPSVKVETESDN